MIIPSEESGLERRGSFTQRCYPVTLLVQDATSTIQHVAVHFLYPMEKILVRIVYPTVGMENDVGVSMTIM